MMNVSGPDRLDRLLMINEGERPRLIYFATVFFLLGAGLAIGRGTTDALFYKRYGIEYLPVMYLFLSLSLVVTSIIYAAVSDMLPSERFFRLITSILIMLLLGNWGLMSFTSLQMVFPLYFLLYETASEVLLVHSMLYLSQNLDTGQIKRLSPLILAGMQTGVISGGLFLATVPQSIGVQNILLVWAGLLFAAIALLRGYHRHNGISPLFHAGKRTPNRVRHAIAQIGQGARFARRSRLLMNLSFGLFFMVISFYVLRYSVGTIYTANFQDEAALSAFFGILTVAGGSLALLLQLFVTSRVIKHLGTRRANLIFPLAIGTGYAALMVSFTIPFAIFASVLNDTLMPALRNPVHNLFFNALPAYLQGRSRAMSLVLVLPLALAATGALLLLAQRSDEPQIFLIIGACSALGFLYFSIRSNHSYLESMIATLREKVFLPIGEDRKLLNLEDATVSDELLDGIQHGSEHIFSAYAVEMLKVAPDQAIAPVLERLRTASMQTVEQLLPELLAVRPNGLREILNEISQQHRSHCPGTVLMALIELGEDDKKLDQHIKDAIQSDIPQRRVAGIYARFLRGTQQEQANARQLWHTMICSTDDNEVIAALDLVKHLPAATAERGAGQLCIPCVGNNPLSRPATLFEHTNPQVRLAGINILPLLSPGARNDIAEIALEDDHPEVRAAAAEIRFGTNEITRREAYQWIMDSRVSPRAQESILRCVIDEFQPRPLLQSIIRAKADEARLLSVAERQLGGQTADKTQPAALELVCLILNERYEQLIRLALLALEQLEHTLTVATIRAGLLNGDRLDRANAGEALRQITNRELGTLLSNLLDPPRYALKTTAVDRVGSTLRWCSERADPWLKSASLHALNSLPDHA